MKSLRAVVITAFASCMLLVQPSVWADEDSGPQEPTPATVAPQGDSTATPLQQSIDDIVPAPRLPEPDSGAPQPELAALWRAVLPSPTGDPIFDSWPANLGQSAPGGLLEWRDVTATAAPQLPVPIQAALLLKFRTTSASDAPSFGTATLIIPAAEWTGSDPRPVLVNAVPINSLGLRCTPGYAMAHGLHTSSGAENLFPPTTWWWGLTRGYAVLIPDHEGPWMSYAEPTVAGHVTLDAIRATRSVSPNEFSDSRFAVWGYSGGAIAAYAAAMLLDEYAPELSGVLVGAAPGGLVTDYRMVAHRFDGNIASGVLLATSLAMAREHPELLESINHLAQWVATSPVKDTCGDSNGPLGVLGIPLEVATNTGDPLDSAAADTVFRRSDLTGRKSGAPLYIYHGAYDIWLPHEAAQQLYQQQCARGVPAVFRTEPGEHVTVLFAGFPGATNWLDARLRGEPAPNECPTTPTQSPAPGER